jgi:hypothetical protein
MQVKFLTKNETVYFEGQKADLFYIIYKGLFKLQKRNFDPNYKQIDDENINNMNMNRTIINLGQGEIAGTECIMECYKNLNERNYKILKTESKVEISRYKHSLVADDDYNIIIGFNPNLFGSDLFQKIIEYYIPIIEKKDKIIDEYLIKHYNLRKKLKVNYREELSRQISKNHFNFYEDKIKQHLEKFNTQRVKNDKIFPNKLNNYTSKSNPKENLINKKELLIINMVNEVNINKRSTVHSENSKFEKIRKINMDTQSNTREYSNNGLNNESSTSPVKSPLHLKNKFTLKKSVISNLNTIENDSQYKTLNTNSVNPNEDYFQLLNTTSNVQNILYETATQSELHNTGRTHFQTISSEKNLDIYNKKAISRNMSDQTQNYFPIKSSKNLFPRNQISQINIKSFDQSENLLMKKSLAKSFNKKFKFFKNTKDYDSGSYELPLVCRFFEKHKESTINLNN